MTCNVTELHHHLGWFDDTKDVIAVDDGGRTYEIYKLEDVAQAPVLRIREVPNA